jgi:hypothetical protein
LNTREEHIKHSIAAAAAFQTKKLNGKAALFYN